MTGSPAQDLVGGALQQLLASQHAAVYGYSLIGVKLDDPAQIERARTLQDAHRISRDALRDELLARQLSPVAAEPSYLPSVPVTDPASARRWALELEQACAAGYRYLVLAGAHGETTPGAAATAALRRLALAGLTVAAQDAMRWRLLITPATPTVPFPGV